MADQLEPNSSKSKEEEFLDLLIAKGLLLRKARPASRPPRVRRPIKVEGRPISEELIEDRR